MIDEIHNEVRFPPKTLRHCNVHHDSSENPSEREEESYKLGLENENDRVRG